MIVMIDNYDSFTYNLVQYISEFESVTVFRNDEVTISDIENLNPRGIVISPGPGRPENAGICVDAIQYFTNKIPILGVCLGHQAIGVAFGGTVKQAKTIKHGKRSVITHSQEGLFTSISHHLQVMRYHSLIVDRNTLPDTLRITAESTDDHEIMAVEHETFPIYGLQFHPESIGTKAGKEIIQNFIAVTRKEKKKHEEIFTKIK